jgi:DNA-binding transcriptional LysR family regulator
MHAANLDIDLLRSFAAVADTGSFTAAAELVARTQSAVSVQVKRLEGIVGRRVFERTSRSLALTPAGETLLGYARRILQLNDESVRRIAEPPVAGEIRLGITEYFVPNELPAILARFAAAYPDVHLEVRMGLSRDLRDELAQKQFDAVIVRLAPRERDQAIWSEPQVWVAREGFEPMRGAALPLALLPAPCVLREHALESLKRLKRPWKIAFTGSSMASVQAAVCAGLGVSILPRSSLLPGMQVLAKGRNYPDPGRLNVGVLRGAGARTEIVAALERVVSQTLDVLALTRHAA